jgi:integrase
MSARRADFGAIRKLPSGRWQVRYRDRSGRMLPAPTTFATRGDASRWLAATRADLDRGAYFDPSAGEETLAAYTAEWLERRRVRGRPLAPRTAALYRWQLDKHVLPTLGHLPLRHLNRAAVRAWHAKVTGPGGAGTVGAAKCYRLLHAICATAVIDERIARNPCVIIGAGQESSPERPAVSVAEVYALAGAVDPRWRALVLLAAFCGLRFGELAALRRDSLDLLHSTVAVVASVAELSGGIRHVGPPKSDAGRRTVAIPGVIVPDLTEHVARYVEEGRQGLVFVGPKGGPLRGANFGRQVWRPAVRSVGLEGLHFHDLRGCAATLAALSGATTAELLARLGHRRVDVAMRYQRATADRDAALARALSDLVTNNSVVRLAKAAGRVR